MERHKAAEEFELSVRAGFSHFFVQSREQENTMQVLSEAVGRIKNGDGEPIYKTVVWSINSNAITEFLPSLAEEQDQVVVFLKNFHWVLDEKRGPGQYACETTQMILDLVQAFRAKPKKILVIVSPVGPEILPMELKNTFYPIKMDLPGVEELRSICEFVVSSARNSGLEISDDGIDSVVESARGLSSDQAESAFSRSIVEKRCLDQKVVSRVKADCFGSLPGIIYADYEADFRNLIGYDILRQFVLATLEHPLAKGVLLVGPPGCGKTEFGKCVGAYTKRQVFTVEFGNVFGSLVGETYERMNAIIDTIKAAGKSIVFMDEIEKMMAGLSGSNNTSNEITIRAMALWLKFMSESKDVYFLGTCNNIEAFSDAPEYLRIGRWDCAPFYVGLPKQEVREKILDHYCKVFNVKKTTLEMDGWSGSEIQGVCKIASMMGASLKEASNYVIPISKIMGKRINALEKWSKDNSIDASELKLTKELKGRSFDL